jgi:DNA-binding transcriptional LysR family regulator
MQGNDGLGWDDLESFLAIARHGTLSGAARALGVRQTTMGRRLAGLEARAGARLLQKTPRGFVLTPAGEAILGNVERIESEAQAIARRITGGDVRLEGVVRITSVESLAVKILIPGLAAFRAVHPGISLEITADTRNLSLTMREADVALRMARLTQLDLAVRKVAEVGFGVYASPRYLGAMGVPDFAAGAAGHTVILNQVDLMGFPEMQWFSSLTAQARPALRSNSRFAQAAAAEQGLGIACLARYLGDPADLVRLEAPPAPVREVWLAVHQDIRHTPRIRAVTDFLAAELRAKAGILRPQDDTVSFATIPT